MINASLYFGEWLAWAEMALGWEWVVGGAWCMLCRCWSWHQISLAPILRVITVELLMWWLLWHLAMTGTQVVEDSKLISTREIMLLRSSLSWQDWWTSPSTLHFRPPRRCPRTAGTAPCAPASRPTMTSASSLGWTPGCTEGSSSTPATPTPASGSVRRRGMRRTAHKRMARTQIRRWTIQLTRLLCSELLFYVSNITLKSL